MVERDRTPIRARPWSMRSMETELGSREQAIAIYRSTIMQAAELGAESARRVKRRLAQSDLFFLLAVVLGRPDVNRDWVFERCREVKAAPNGYLDLWSREPTCPRNFTGSPFEAAVRTVEERGCGVQPQSCRVRHERPPLQTTRERPKRS